MSLFAITRGQFSMIDAVLHVLSELGPSRLTLWTWTIAEYEIQEFRRLQESAGVTSGLLVIDAGAREKNGQLLKDWAACYGPGSVRYVVNHAKIATVDNGTLRVCLRGSMNLNMNPRFEQLDVTEGGPDFDLVREVEDELPILDFDAGGSEVYEASRVGEAFDLGQMAMFKGLKPWRK